MFLELNPQKQFRTAINQHFKPLANKLTIPFTRFDDDHCFFMFAADISVHLYFFEPHSSAGYDVVVGIAPKHEPRWNPPGELGLIWFTKYLGIAGMPEDRINLAVEISERVRVLSELTDRVLERVFASGQEFWPPFYAFVEMEIAKMPKPPWVQNSKQA